MPPRPTFDNEGVLSARGTLPRDRGTMDRLGSDRMIAQAFLPWLEPLAGSLGERAMMPRVMPRVGPSPSPAPRLTPTSPMPIVGPKTDRRRSEEDSEAYSGAFRPDFFPYSHEGRAAGEKKAYELRDIARGIQRHGWGTAVLIVERQRMDGSRFLVAGINGSFNEKQHAALDRLGIRERYNLRDRNQTQGHPDVNITFGQIGAVDSQAVAIGSSIPFCRIC